MRFVIIGMTNRVQDNEKPQYGRSAVGRANRNIMLLLKCILLNNYKIGGGGCLFAFRKSNCIEFID